MNAGSSCDSRWVQVDALATFFETDPGLHVVDVAPFGQEVCTSSWCWRAVAVATAVHQHVAASSLVEQQIAPVSFSNTSETGPIQAAAQIMWLGVTVGVSRCSAPIVCTALTTTLRVWQQMLMMRRLSTLAWWLFSYRSLATLPLTQPPPPSGTPPTCQQQPQRAHLTSTTTRALPNARPDPTTSRMRRQPCACVS